MPSFREQESSLVPGQLRQPESNRIKRRLLLATDEVEASTEIFNTVGFVAFKITLVTLFPSLCEIAGQLFNEENYPPV